jgi:hypothetical protein
MGRDVGKKVIGTLGRNDANREKKKDDVSNAFWKVIQGPECTPETGPEPFRRAPNSAQESQRADSPCVGSNGADGRCNESKIDAYQTHEKYAQTGEEFALP